MSAGGQDAAALTALLGAEVDVSAEDGKTRRGRLFSVDSVSRSLVLLQASTLHQRSAPGRGHLAAAWLLFASH